MFSIQRSEESQHVQILHINSGKDVKQPEMDEKLLARCLRLIVEDVQADKGLFRCRLLQNSARIRRNDH